MALITPRLPVRSFNDVEVRRVENGYIIFIGTSGFHRNECIERKMYVATDPNELGRIMEILAVGKEREIPRLINGMENA